MHQILNFLLQKYTNVIVIGDINIDVLIDSSSTKQLKDALGIYQMNFLVDFPTPYTPTSQTAIDNLLTNISVNTLIVYVVNTQISDRDGLILKIFNVNICANDNNKVKLKNCRNFTKVNMDIFKGYLSNESWIEVFNAPVEFKFDVFLKHFYVLLYLFP